ncbi:unnamed protein product [Cercospora beticola]|nr:unnamed protein product [Cercospora beticola]
MDIVARRGFLSRAHWYDFFRSSDNRRRLSEPTVPKDEHETSEPPVGELHEPQYSKTTYISSATQTDSAQSSNGQDRLASNHHDHGDQCTASEEARRSLNEEGSRYQTRNSISHCEEQDPEDFTASPNQDAKHLHVPEHDSELIGNNLSEDELQNLRLHSYIMFDTEEREDYTAGPARIIEASDGVKKDSAALLLTLDLSARLREAIQAQRLFDEREYLTLRKRRQLWNLQLDIESEIAAREYRLRRIETDESDVEGLDKVQQELENMQLLLENVQLRQQQAQAQVQTQADILRTCLKDALRILEEAYVIANLVESGPEEPEFDDTPLDLQTEYQNFVRDLQADSENGSQAGSTHSVAMLELAGNNFMQSAPPPLSPEAQQRHDAKEAFYEARQNLHEAQIRFDRKEEDQAQARHEERETEDDEETAAFDLHWFQRNRQITRELIEAEEQLAKAKAKALALGVEIRLEDQASGFSVGEDEEEGAPAIRESWEGEATAAHFSRTKVDEWLGTVDEQSSGEQVGDADTDDWDAQEVEISESRSLVAWGPPRKKIDKWQQDCTLCRDSHISSK